MSDQNPPLSHVNLAGHGLLDLEGHGCIPFDTLTGVGPIETDWKSDGYIFRLRAGSDVFGLGYPSESDALEDRGRIITAWQNWNLSKVRGGAL